MSMMRKKAKRLEKKLSSNTSYKDMKEDKVLILDEAIEQLENANELTPGVKRILEVLSRMEMESEMNDLKRVASCPTGFLDIFLCPCGFVNRRSYVFCPNCHRKHITSCDVKNCIANSSVHGEGCCLHLNRGISVNTDVLCFTYYPIWNCLLDLFAANDDEFLACLTRREIAQHISYDNQYDIISSVASFNSFSAYRALGENQLADLAKIPLLKRVFPLSMRAFLNPDPEHSHEKYMQSKSEDGRGE